MLLGSARPLTSLNAPLFQQQGERLSPADRVEVAAGEVDLDDMLALRLLAVEVADHFRAGNAQVTGDRFTVVAVEGVAILVLLDGDEHAAAGDIGPECRQLLVAERRHPLILAVAAHYRSPSPGPVT